MRLAVFLLGFDNLSCCLNLLFGRRQTHEHLDVDHSQQPCRREPQARRARGEDQRRGARPHPREEDEPELKPAEGIGKSVDRSPPLSILNQPERPSGILAHAVRVINRAS